MSTWNDVPYSYVPGSDRLLGPVNKASSAAYDFQASNGLVQDATELNKGTSYYLFKNSANPPTPPSAPPGVPFYVGGATASTITMNINVAGVQGSPPPVYSVLYGTTPNPATPFPAYRAFGSLYTAQLTGLQSNTSYYFKSVATNAAGQQISAVSVGVTTSDGTGTAPSAPPTVPVVSGTPTSSTITVTFDVAGITGSPPPYYTVLVGPTTNPTGPFPATFVSGTTYQAVATGLAPNTNYYFKSVAQNGISPNQVSAVSAAIKTGTGPTPPPPTGPLQTLCHHTFLVPIAPFIYSYVPPPGTSSGGNAPIDAALTWVLNADAPNGAANSTYGDFYCRSFIDTTKAPYSTIPTIVPNITTGGCYNTDGLDYSAVSNSYLGSINSQPNTKLIVSLGGFYGDVLGFFGPYVVPGAVAGWVTPTGVDLVDSIAYAFYNNSGAPNPMGWARTGSGNTTASTWGAQTWDGLNIDFENIGLGGRLIQGGAWGTTQWPPALTTDRNFVPALTDVIGASSTTYGQYVGAIKDMIVHHGTAYPDKILTSAPISLAINGDESTNITATQNALGTWFAFPTSDTVPSDQTYNSAASDAMIHPSVLCYFDDVFVQFYNEGPDVYLGGKNFVNLVAQWGYVALKAQAQGKKNVRINIGLAYGQVSNITDQNPPPPVATFPPGGTDGPTAPFSPNPAPFTYFYPQFATASPPNPPPSAFPNISVAGDPQTLSDTLKAATAILITSFPGITTASWCSGAGFFAGAPATQMAKNIYTSSSQYFVPGLPAGATYLWGEAYFPAVQPGWQGNVPIVAS